MTEAERNLNRRVQARRRAFWRHLGLCVECGSYPIFGWCFYRAGWRFHRVSADGKHILEKHLACPTGGPT